MSKMIGTKEHAKGKAHKNALGSMKEDAKAGVKHLHKHHAESDRKMERSRIKGDVRSA